MDIYQVILEKALALPPGRVLQLGDFDSNIDKLVLCEHVKLLEEGGYLEAKIVTGVSEGYSYAAIKFIIFRLTFAGQNYVAASRVKSVWEKMKDIAKAEGKSLPLTLMDKLANMLAKKYLGIE